MSKINQLGFAQYSDYWQSRSTETDICPSCNGSGEGLYDGSTCQQCRGSGEIDADEHTESAYGD